MIRLKLLAAEPWMVHGLCRQVDPDVWFAEKGHWATTVKAKRFCRQCVVRTECLQYALDNGEVHGVWGGLTPEERRDLRRYGRRAGDLAS